jgi:hypothetical protein
VRSDRVVLQVRVDGGADEALHEAVRQLADQGACIALDGVAYRPELEPLLEQDGLIACALGIRGFSRTGTNAMHLERASIEGDMRFSVYGKAFLDFPRAT